MLSKNIFFHIIKEYIYYIIKEHIYYISIPLSEVNVTVNTAPGAPDDRVVAVTETDSLPSKKGRALKAFPISSPSVTVCRGSV